MKLYLKTEIEVNENDERRCSINCQHVEKIRGIYHCTLFEQDVDDGEIEDDEIGYGFKRIKYCVEQAMKESEK